MASSERSSSSSKKTRKRRLITSGNSLFSAKGFLSGIVVIALVSFVGSYYLTRSHASSSYSTTALTVVAGDGVVSNAICLNSVVAVGSQKLTDCLQTNPAVPGQVRLGRYNPVTKDFAQEKTWVNLANVTQATDITVSSCPGSGNTFLGIGPVTTYYGNGYFGEEIIGGTAYFGFYNTTSGGCARGSVSGAYLSGQWATPVINCSGTGTSVATEAQLQNAVSTKPNGAEICIKPGHYMLTKSITLKTGVRLVGNPLNRAILDAGNLNSGSTKVISALGANATIANVVAQNTKRIGSCINCAFGIDSGAGWHLYNVKMTNNDENGFHYYHPTDTTGYVVENSDISNNGTMALVGNTSGGLKVTSGGILRNNVAMNNIGVGLWCDVGCKNRQWTVQDNYLEGNYRSGVRYEISYVGALITNNVFVNNNTDVQGSNGALSLVYTKNVQAHNNVFHGSHVNGIIAIDDTRSYPTSGNITATNNYMNGDKVSCMSSATIDCSPNY